MKSKNEKKKESSPQTVLKNVGNSVNCPPHFGGNLSQRHRKSTCWIIPVEYVTILLKFHTFFQDYTEACLFLFFLILTFLLLPSFLSQARRNHSAGRTSRFLHVIKVNVQNRPNKTAEPKTRSEVTASGTTSNVKQLQAINK